MSSPDVVNASANGASTQEKPTDTKSVLDSPTRRSAHKSRSRSRDRHSSSRSHRERERDRDHRDRDRDRRRGDRSDRDKDRDRDRDRDDRHRSRRSTRSPAPAAGSVTEDRHRDRDRDRERRHRDRDDRDGHRDRERDRDGGRRDKDKDYDRDRDRDRDRRRRKLDEMDDTASPRPDERSLKRARGADGDEQPSGNGSPMPDVVPTRERSMESDRRSPKRSDGGGARSLLPVDDRSPPPPPPRRSPPPRRGPPDDDRDRPAFGRRRSPPPRRRRPSPSYENNGHGGDRGHGPNDDSEARSVFVSQLAARMTAKDLGFFFEEHLGEGSVIDPRIVTDRLSRRSKGIAYVELASIDLVQKAIELSGTVVMGLPIRVQLTEAERNKQPSTSDPSGLGGSSGAMQLYVGSLHFNLTEADIKQVFEPFGELEFVDLHKDPATGRSKGYAFVQFKRSEDAKMALEQMEGFELAGRQLRVNTVHEKGSAGKTGMGGMGMGMGGPGGVVDSLDENGGSLNNNSSRHILMQKLARTEAPVMRAPVMRPIIPEAKTRNVALKNMFDPAEETEQDWDTDLAEDVKGECTDKYGPVTGIKVIKESQGEIYVQFDTVESAAKALSGLNGRWFGGRLVSASYVSDVIMQAYL